MKTDLGQELLQSIAKAYREIKTYRDETEQHLSIVSREKENNVNIHYAFVLERPNKFAAITMTEKAGLTIISNGEKIWIYVPVLKSYMVVKTPENLEKFIENDLSPLLEFSAESRYVKEMGAPAILWFFGYEPYARLTEDLKEVKTAGEEMIEGVKTIHLILKQSDADFHYWIDIESHLVRKIRSEVTKKLIEEETGIKLDPIRIVFEESHGQIKIDGETSQKDFIFKPPRGTQQVDNLFDFIETEESF